MDIVGCSFVDASFESGAERFSVLFYAPSAG